jgi:hypothetical protein
MRLLTVLLLSAVSLSADTSDRLPNTKKPVPVHTATRGAPGSAGRAGTQTMRLTPKAAHKVGKRDSKQAAQGNSKNGAIARAVSGGVTSAKSSKARAKVILPPRLK